MVNPRTVNSGIIVPLTGANVDLWGELDVNPNMVALDGFIGGVQTVALTNVPVTLTAPAGFTATPTAGPTQSQNRVLRFTGVLTANVLVTLPLPGAYIVENLTTGNFVLQLRAVTATEIIAIEQGSRHTIYSDGANVRFSDLGNLGEMEFWTGLTAMPNWVNACSVRPYLLADGTIFNISDAPYLGARYGATFGGNGVTTSAVPDLRGRLPLAYDGTGTRITVAGCGINGQLLGASLDRQTVTIAAANLPPYTPAGTIANGLITVGPAAGSFIPTGSGTAISNSSPSGSFGTGGSLSASQAPSTFTGTAAPGQISTPLTNVQPSQVAGIWVIKT